MIELVVSTVVLTVLMGAFFSSINGMMRLAQVGEAKASMKREANRALEAVLEDLRRSGFVTVGGTAYPVLSASAFADSVATADESDFGVSRDITFVLPADVDADGDPDVDANGRLVWSLDEVSYVHVTGADGVPVVERRVNGGVGRVVARHVERMTFDDAVTTGFQLPQNAIRVQLCFRKADEDGVVHRYAVEVTIRPRNT